MRTWNWEIIKDTGHHYETLIACQCWDSGWGNADRSGRLCQRTHLFLILPLFPRFLFLIILPRYNPIIMARNIHNIMLRISIVAISVSVRLSVKLISAWTKIHGCEPSLREVRNERRSNPLIFNEIASVVPPSQWQKECNSVVFGQALIICLSNT